MDQQSKKAETGEENSKKTDISVTDQIEKL